MSTSSTIFTPVKLDKGTEFVGVDALRRIKQDGFDRKIVPVKKTDRGIARGGHEVIEDGSSIGRVTSGTKGPSVGDAVALAYVPKRLSKKGTPLSIDIRGRAVAAEVVGRPFYKKDSDAQGS